MCAMKACAQCGEPVKHRGTRIKFCSHPCYVASRQRPTIDRFWEGVAKAGPDQCWMWTGSRTKAGYGQLSINAHKVYTHRLSLELHGTPIPPDALVMHTCDTPACVNPAHLRIGTDADNIADKVSKRRHIHGDTHPRAKLRSGDIGEIRRLLASGLSQGEIATRYNVCPSLVSNIKTGRLWKSVA